jgi:hypothetical protein
LADDLAVEPRAEAPATPASKATALAGGAPGATAPGAPKDLDAAATLRRMWRDPTNPAEAEMTIHDEIEYEQERST